MIKIEFSLAEKRELEEIMKVYYEAIKEMDMHNINQWDDLYPDKEIIEEDITKKQLYLGRSNGSIVCAFVINKESDEDYLKGKWQYPHSEYRVLHRLCVNPQFQNMGVGALTLHHIENYLKKEDVEAIRLDVFSGNPFALKMYNKAGYNKTGEVHFRKGKFYLMEKKL